MSECMKLRTHLEEYGQSHLLQFWDQITDEQKRSLVDQLNNINLKEVVSYFNTAQESLNKDVVKLDDRMKPLPGENYDSSVEINLEDLESYNHLGLEKIANGEVNLHFIKNILSQKCGLVMDINLDFLKMSTTIYLKFKTVEHVQNIKIYLVKTT